MGRLLILPANQYCIYGARAGLGYPGHTWGWALRAGQQRTYSCILLGGRGTGGPVMPPLSYVDISSGGRIAPGSLRMGSTWGGEITGRWKHYD